MAHFAVHLVQGLYLYSSRRELLLKKRQAFNMFVVWACTGMWHGAAWNFVVWGMWFYILLVGEKYLWGKGLGKMPAVFQHIYALLAAVISWVFFRAPDLPYAFDYLKAMFSFGGTLTDSQAVYYLLQYAPELILCVIASIPVKSTRRMRSAGGRDSTAVRIPRQGERSAGAKRSGFSSDLGTEDTRSVSSDALLYRAGHRFFQSVYLFPVLA